MYVNLKLLRENRYPTPESLQITNLNLEGLIEQAKARIVTADMLDGYVLPPDDDELWDPRPMTMRNGVSGAETILPRILTNAYVRKSHISCIAQGLEPLYTRDDDPEFIRRIQNFGERQKRDKGPLRKLMFKALGWS